MSSTRTAGRRDSRPPAARTTRVARTTRTARTARTTRTRSPRHRMLLVCTGALAAGFVAVLLLNTIISQGAFRQHELEIQLILLAEEEEALARAVQQAEAPLEVERAARKLGMVPAAAPVFLRLSDGKVLGEPVPAPAPTAPVDFAGAPGIQPTPVPSPSTSASSTDIDPALDPASGLDAAASPVPDPSAASPAPDPIPGVNP